MFPEIAFAIKKKRLVFPGHLKNRKNVLSNVPVLIINIFVKAIDHTLLYSELKVTFKNNSLRSIPRAAAALRFSSDVSAEKHPARRRKAPRIQSSVMIFVFFSVVCSRRRKPSQLRARSFIVTSVNFNI